MFQEGYDAVCEQAFREIARLTGGAFCRFTPGAAHELAELLRAAAAYAAGGMKALADLKARQQRRRGPAARAIEIAQHSTLEPVQHPMPEILLGVIVLFLLLVGGQRLLQGRSQTGRARVARDRRRRGADVSPGFSCFAARSALPYRSGCSASACSAGCRCGRRHSARARRKARGQASRSARHSSKWNSITTAAPCTAAFLPGQHAGRCAR